MTILPSPQQLRYLTALAESRHFGRAALACSVTQSTLSAGILTLERQLDAAILDRNAGKHVVFTPLGSDLVARAGAALAALEAVVEAAEAARAPMGGPLRLGVIPTIGPFLLPRLMPMLRHAFPQLRLYLREDTTAHLVERLESTGWTCCSWHSLATAAPPRQRRWPATSFWLHCRPVTGWRLRTRYR